MMDQVISIVVEFSDLIVLLIAVSLAFTIADWVLDHIHSAAIYSDDDRGY